MHSDWKSSRITAWHDHQGKIRPLRGYYARLKECRVSICQSWNNPDNWLVMITHWGDARPSHCRLAGKRDVEFLLELSAEEVLEAVYKRH